MKTKIMFFLSALLLSACTTLQTITFERLQAGDVNFPEQIRTVGVVNYVAPDNQKADSLLGCWSGDGKVATEVLAHEIAATDYFNQVVICDSALRETGVENSDTLSVSLVDSLIRALGVDMLFAVEKVQIELKKGSLFHTELMMDVPALDGAITPLLRAYVAERKAPLFSVVKTDTICWVLSPELTFDQIIEEASEFAATLPVASLLPHWKEMNRFYFDGGNMEMRDAGVYVREQNWEEASVLWQKLYDTRKGKVKMRAAYNLAVYYEFQEDFERAKEYLNTALALSSEGSWENQLIELYLIQLEEQARQNRMLRIQMNRFEP